MKQKCESCGGVGIISPLSKFKEKLLCGDCIIRWIRLDEKLQRKSSFEEMIAGGKQRKKRSCV